MGQAIGLLELKSIPIGIKAVDEMLKAADVKPALATPICPGKFVVLITGDVSAVNSAMKNGILAGGIFVVDSQIISNLHESVIPALVGTSVVENIGSIGIIETISALASVKAGDIAAKAAAVELVEIRIARGLGGKGFLTVSGEVSTVQSAIKAVENELGATGEITSTAVIPAPHKDLLPLLNT